MSAFRRNVGWQTAGTAAQAVLGAAFLFFIGRHLGAAGFGTYSVAIGAVLVANALFEPRLQDVVARRFWDLGGARPDTSHRRAVLDLLAFEVIGKALPAAVVIVLSPLLASLMQLPANGSLLISAAAVTTYFNRLGAGVSVGLLRVQGRSDVFAGVSIAEIVLRLALAFLLVWQSWLSPLTCILAAGLSGVLTNLVQLRIALTISRRGEVGERWTPRGLVARLRESRRLIASNLGLSAADLMSRDLDITLMAPFVSSAEIGVYKMAKNIALLAWRFVDPFYLAFMPEMSRLVATSARGALDRLIGVSVVGLFAFTLLIAGAAWLVTDLAGVRILGAAYAGMPQLLPWAMAGVVLSAPFVWGHPLCVALDRPELALAGSLIGSSVGLCAFLLLAPIYGAYGAAAAWSCTLLLNFLFTAGAAFNLLNRRVKATSQVTQ